MIAYYWRCKVRSKEDNLSGLKYVLAGLALMAIAIASVELVFLFKEIVILNWAKIAVKAIAWLLVIAGLYLIKNTRIEFKRSLFVSIIGILTLAGSGLLALMDYKAGLGDIAFMNIKVMFAAYVADLCMIGVFLMVVRGMGQLVAKAGNKKLGANSMRLTKIAVVAILASMVVTPFAHIWPIIVKIILGVIAIAIGFIAEIAMIIYANQSYKEI